MEPLYKPDVLEDRLIPRCHESMQQGFTTRITTEPKDILCFGFFFLFIWQPALFLLTVTPHKFNCTLTTVRALFQGSSALQLSTSPQPCKARSPHTPSCCLTTDPRVTWTQFATPR